MSWDRVELWWVMILKVIPLLIFQKTRLKTGSPRIISCENLLETWHLFGNFFCPKTNFLANKQTSNVKSPHLPKKNNLNQPLWKINPFWLVFQDTTALEDVFFRNPSFGIRRRNNQMFRTIGCDYCFWTIHFRNRYHLPGPRLHGQRIKLQIFSEPQTNDRIAQICETYWITLVICYYYYYSVNLVGNCCIEVNDASLHFTTYMQWLYTMPCRQLFPAQDFPISTNTDNNLKKGVDSNLVSTYANI